MGLIAIAALSLTFHEMFRRSQQYRSQAEYHRAASRQLETDSRSFLCGYGMSDAQLEAIAVRRSDERRIAMEASKYHLRMSALYQLASERPWLPVNGGPPPPGSYPRLVSADDY
jgi:hypothetical protein